MKKNYVVLYMSDFAKTDLWLGLLDSLHVSYEFDENDEPTVQYLEMWSQVADSGPDC